jgi:hypothetical protein
MNLSDFNKEIIKTPKINNGVSQKCFSEKILFDLTFKVNIRKQILHNKINSLEIKTFFCDKTETNYFYLEKQKTDEKFIKSVGRKVGKYTKDEVQELIKDYFLNDFYKSLEDSGL